MLFLLYFKLKTFAMKIRNKNQIKSKILTLYTHRHAQAYYCRSLCSFSIIIKRFIFVFFSNSNRCLLDVDCEKIEVMLCIRSQLFADFIRKMNRWRNNERNKKSTDWVYTEKTFDAREFYSIVSWMVEWIECWTRTLIIRRTW